MSPAKTVYALLLVIGLLAQPGTSGRALACEQPGIWSVAAAFDQVANGVTSDGLPADTVPPSLLKAIGWVESNWRQFNTAGVPLVSPDFGYGIMQVTSGMAGAFGQPIGSIPAASQSRIASQYLYNIAYGAQILGQKWDTTPRIGKNDPTAIEDWYYAIWAYNGWGWVNNPNNPRFLRLGTPATQPSTWPYQERVLYLVAHPPRDSQGNPLWKPIPVTLPSKSTIGSNPGHFTPAHLHRQAPAALSATYFPGKIRSTAAGGTLQVRVRVANTGTQPWVATGDNAIHLTYHLFTKDGNPWGTIAPFSSGVEAYGQSPVPLQKDILPGQSALFTETLDAPDQPGHYRVVWDLEEDPGTWFNQQGVLPRVTSWKVTTRKALPRATSAVTPTPTPQAARDLSYVADTAAPDGTRETAGAAFQKGWLVFNSGAEPWASGWKLKRIGGTAMGRNSIAAPHTAPCSSANLLISLKAPKRAGTYTSKWSLVDSSGHRIGDVLTVNIVVSTGPGPGSTPTPSPIPSPTRPPKPTATPTPVG